MRSLFLEAEAWKPEEICLYINNSWPTDVDVRLNFVDWTITADWSQNKACQPEWTQSNFGEFVTYNEDIITIRAWTTLETRAHVTFPDWFSWLSYGCVTMMFADEEDTDDEERMFNILTRRWYFIDMLVWWDINLSVDLKTPPISFGNIWTSEHLYVYQTDTWLLKAAVTIENTWNIAQDVSVIPTISWIQYRPVTGENRLEQSIVNWAIVTEPVLEWSNDSERTPVTKRILPNQSVTFDFDLQSWLPLWRGPIDLSAVVSYTPVFDFVAADIYDTLKETKTLTLSSEFFVMPWLVIWCIVAILLIIVISTAQKPKKIEEQHAVSSTTRTRKKTPTTKRTTKKNN